MTSLIFIFILIFLDYKPGAQMVLGIIHHGRMLVAWLGSPWVRPQVGQQ